VKGDKVTEHSPGLTLSREQARAFDRRAIDEIGIPSLVLMENAGRNTASILFAQGVRGPVVICCGKGNNGGDGLVIARHLRNWGAEVRVLLFARPGELSPDAAVHWRVVQNMRIAAQIWQDLDEARLTAELSTADWIVDALFGTGLTGPVRAPFDRIIACINASQARVLAVDIPSGLDADTGEPLGATVRAQQTVTFVAPKRGYANPAAASWLGQVHVADIGLVSEGPTLQGTTASLRS
jgi:NAD(P)H-hydrate epimerase